MKSTESRGLAALRRITLPVACAAAVAGCAATNPGASAPLAARAAVASPPPAQVAQSQPGRRVMTAQVPTLPPGHPRVSGAGDESSENLPDVQLTPQLLFRLLASEIAVQRGDIGSAALTYLALARETRDPRLARRATELGITERSATALAAARLWHEIVPDSAIAAQTLEGLLLVDGRFNEAEPLLKRRLAAARAEGTLAEAYAQLRRNLPTVRDRGSALRLIGRISTDDQGVAEARLTIAAVAHAAGEHPRAEAEIAEAIQLRPDDRAVLLTGIAYATPGKEGSERARAHVVRFLARHPQDAAVRFVHAQMLAADAQDAAAQAEFESALAIEPDNPRILIVYAQFAHRTRQIALAEEMLKRYIALPPQPHRNPGPVLLMLGAIAEESNRPEEALKWYAQIEHGEQFFPALTRRAALLAKTGRVPEARDLLRTTPAATSSERVRLIAAEAELLRGLRQHAVAFEVLDAALPQFPEDHDLLYAHAMGAERVDRLDAMEKSLRRLIELDPKHAHAHNALGYTFADRNVRLPEAQNLIEKALALLPDSPHILDSMGWVLFRRGQLASALEYLFKAYKATPEAEIAAHLGEVLWASERRDEASAIWREALGADPDNDTLRGTLRRLGVTL